MKTIKKQVNTVEGEEVVNYLLEVTENGVTKQSPISVESINAQIAGIDARIAGVESSKQSEKEKLAKNLAFLEKNKQNLLESKIEQEELKAQLLAL